jgi:nucleotide-binding universal stress UspA family protein
MVRSSDGVAKDAEELNLALEHARAFDDQSQVNVGGVVVNVADSDQDARVGPVSDPPSALSEYIEELVRRTDKLVDTEEERARGLAVLYWNQAHVLKTVREQVQDLEGVVRELELYPERERTQAAEEGRPEPEPILRESLLRQMLFGHTEGIPSRRLRKVLHRKEKRYPGRYHDPKREQREESARRFKEDTIAVHEILFDVLEELRRFRRKEESKETTDLRLNIESGATEVSHGSS